MPRQESIAARNMQTKLHFATASFDRVPRSLSRKRERKREIGREREREVNDKIANIRKQREPELLLLTFIHLKEEDCLTRFDNFFHSRRRVNFLNERLKRVALNIRMDEALFEILNELGSFYVKTWIESILTIWKGNLNFSCEKDWKFCGRNPVSPKWRKKIFQSVAKIRRELKFLSMCLRDSERS